jgi:hypothetical protein
MNMRVEIPDNLLNNWTLSLSDICDMLKKYENDVEQMEKQLEIEQELNSENTDKDYRITYLETLLRENGIDFI